MQIHRQEHPPQLLCPRKTAKALDVSIRTLREWTARGVVPVRYVGRLPRYCLAEVLAALPTRRFSNAG